ncbi:MAG: hypothetical protein N2312_06915 [Dictyoglomaceae bacterium]|nr:hypothetical protein [Dictyoglomaceae bacterium]
MSIWWIKELELRLKSKRYIKIEISIFLLLILILVLFWPDSILNLKTFNIANLSLVSFSIQALIIFYLSSLIASGNLLAEREFKIFDLVKYAPEKIWNIVLGKFLSVFSYIFILIILLLPINILANYASSPFEIRIHYFLFLILLDSFIFISLGILWSTIYNPTLNWTAHWLSYLIFLFLPFLIPFLNPYLPLNNILWAGMAQHLLSLDITFGISHFLIVISSYLIISFLLLFISQFKLKSWRKNNENFSRNK